MTISQLSRHFQSTKKKEIQESPSSDKQLSNPFQLTVSCEEVQ